MECNFTIWQEVSSFKDGKVLVAHAIGHRNTFLPGGHVEFGESAKDALVREIDEELGITCTVGKFLGLVEHKWMNKGVLHCEVNQLFEVHSEKLHNRHKSRIERAAYRVFLVT